MAAVEAEGFVDATLVGGQAALDRFHGALNQPVGSRFPIYCGGG